MLRRANSFASLGAAFSSCRVMQMALIDPWCKYPQGAGELSTQGGASGNCLKAPAQDLWKWWRGYRILVPFNTHPDFNLVSMRT